MVATSPGLGTRGISEIGISNSILHDPIQVPFESLRVTSITFDGSGTLGLVDTDSMEVHLQYWPLKGTREGVYAPGQVVELWHKCLEDLESYAAVEAIIDPEPLRF
jgi:hypothetical protein